MKFRLIIDKDKEEEILATVHSRTPLIDKIEALINENKTQNEIVGYEDGDIVVLDIDNIEAFYIESGKTYASCIDKSRYLVKKPLYELEAVLPQNFRKINKSDIANMNHIVRFRTTLSGAVDAVFRSGFSDYVSRRCFAELRRRYSL